MSINIQRYITDFVFIHKCFQFRFCSFLHDDGDNLRLLKIEFSCSIIHLIILASKSQNDSLFIQKQRNGSIAIIKSKIV